jgi:hypothetical protein
MGGGAEAAFEVLVGLDGPDPDSEHAARTVWGTDVRGDLRVVAGTQVGLAAVRNRLLEIARGRWTISINDDVLAEPGFLEAHARAHREQERLGRPAIIVGDSPWFVYEDDTLFDRLVRETSLIFFYDQMQGSTDPERDWGFRHCFGLNHSAATEAMRAVGGYAAFPATYGYEDNEIAWRLKERYGMPVLYRPEARAVHDHRYDPAGYLEREEKLGFAAWGFARTAPECAAVMFGRDVTSDDEIEYSRQFVQRERRAADRLRRSFLHLREIAASALRAEHAGELVNLVYEQHLLLKRWTWRKGLVGAAEAACAAGARR